MKELQDAKEKIKTLQAACQGYKSEVERINTLRQRRTEASASSGVTEARSQTSAKAKSSNSTLYLLLIVALVSFFLGRWIF